MSKQRKDPADAGQEIAEKESIDGELSEQVIDLDTYSVSDLAAIKPSATRIPHPFEGYPEKKAVLNGIKLNLTHVVVLDPQFEKSIVQDPSGMDTTVTDTKTRKDRIIDMYTPYSKVVFIMRQGGAILNAQPTDVVFDRVLNLKDGEVKCAIVPDHSARSQLFFERDHRGRLQVVKHMNLLDGDQIQRLRRVFFEIVEKQQKAGEQNATQYDIAAAKKG